MSTPPTGPALPPGLVPPIRVVHVVTTLNVGGLEKVVLDLVRSRTKGVFNAHVICLDSTGVVERGFREQGVQVETIGIDGSVPRRILRLARRLRDVGPHIVHTHNPQAHLHGAWAARLANVPVVVHTKHGRGCAEGRLVAALSRVASAWTSRVIAVSEDAARVARAVDRVPLRKLMVIHNGIDVERFPFRETRPTRTGGRAVTVGRLDPIKDQGTMLRAVRLVVDNMPGFRLDVVGDGPSRPALEALRSALGLDAHVCFHGYRDQVASYLESADFFVLSSISEGVPLALLEAMASGLPGVATDVGGIREVIVPDETGYLVHAQSPGLLADAMLRILSTPGALDRMGGAARRRVEEHFSLRAVVGQYEELYMQCLGISAPGMNRAN